MDKKLLFVCLGNICRSPAAEGIMQHIIDRNGANGWVSVDSAGTYGGHAGEKADARMRAAASRRGYDLTSRSRQVRLDDFDKFDMLLAMDDSNYERLHRLAPSVEAASRIFRMTEFCHRYPDADHIPDPYYEGSQGFEIVLDLLEDACEGLWEKINEK